MDFSVPKIDKYIDVNREVNERTNKQKKQTKQCENDVNTYCNCCAYNNPGRLVKEPEDVEIKAILSTELLRFGQNTQKYPEDIRRLALTQTIFKKKPSADVDVRSNQELK